MLQHSKVGLIGLSAALVLLTMPIDAEARTRTGFGAVRSAGRFAERPAPTKVEPAGPSSTAPMAASAATSAAPVSAAAALAPPTAPSAGTVCIAGCYAAPQSDNARRSR